MVRTPLTPEERERGERLGLLLRSARGERSMVEIAAAAGLSAETLRKIETGRAPTPAFFTVAALARVLDLSMDELVVLCTPAPAPAPTPAPAATPVPAPVPAPAPV
ncbi:putative DNA-binding protein [Streptomyces venezuelae]|uniref:helix-turn-helix domain-containing protein n=1 Tax=Streptomyces gardneri TaxID=66892 RepID=UPI0006E1DCEB|nr:helix-turn-helix transcriptional regulator [Streptomyces gardneri]ALO11914.1 putative DNA-binding protein [Streptomyces venezuelae]QPK48768.1 helix-turn-helix domain-containing protein [Streptomyces gardneri]WRK40248.1 helix-turn-helix transcriptional regulator [Streptomyces venezuelae]